VRTAPYREKCGRARDPGNFKTRTLHKSKSAALAKDQRSLRCCGRVGHPPVAVNLAWVCSDADRSRKGRPNEKKILGEKAAERDALRASDVMSELKLRPPNPYGGECGRARDPAIVKTRALHKSKSAAPAKDKRSLRCCGRARDPGNFKTRTLHKSPFGFAQDKKSAEPAKDKRSLGAAEGLATRRGKRRTLA
jgi:hypothetical protein